MSSTNEIKSYFEPANREITKNVKTIHENKDKIRKETSKFCYKTLGQSCFKKKSINILVFKAEELKKEIDKIFEKRKFEEEDLSDLCNLYLDEDAVKIIYLRTERNTILNHIEIFD